MYEIFIPTSDILKKYIHNFYVMQEFTGEVNYLAFPQLGTSIALYSNADCMLKDNCIAISRSKIPEAKILLLGKYKLPIQIAYQNFVPEISINFTPTGLNYFFKEDTCDIAKKDAQLTNDEKWIRVANQIFFEKTVERKIEMLENFLLNNMIKKDLSLIENYLAAVNENPEITISLVADKLKVSAKTINRYFARYIGCSPMDFKKVLRFRKAINTKFNNPSDNLTQICFDSNFYDSPHFTREFKKLTHMSPSKFFSHIVPVAEKDIPYQFL